MSNEYQRQYYEKNKEKIKLRQKENYLKNREERIRKSVEYNKINPKRKTQEFKEANKEYSKKWRKENPLKDKERYKKDNLILKVRSETKKKFKREKVCSKCGSKEYLEFHHLIYRRPVQKGDFITLCKSCHTKEHIGDLT